MTLKEFDELIGNGSYVKCLGKKRIDARIVGLKEAQEHIFSGGQIGWWVTPGHIIVDIDEGKEEALKVVKELRIRTLMAKTPKGLHVYFKTEKEYTQNVGMILPCGLKCDYRCAGKGYVILPFGSEGRAFNRRTNIIDMPECMTPLHRRDSLYGLKEGDGRNASLFSHLMAYKNRGATDKQVDKMAHIINDIVFGEPVEERELLRIIDNTKNYEAKNPEGNPYIIYSSKGAPVQVNRRALCDYFVNRGDIFAMGGECYLYQNGVYREASSTVRGIMRELIAYDKFITQPTIMECFRLLIDDVAIQKSPDQLNKDKNLINFRNGVWDIEAQKLLPHDKKYLQTIQIPHEVGLYVKFTDSRLYGFLKKTKLKNEDIKMVLRYMAYCMTLSNSLKTFMVLLGKSNTGKSVLIRFIESIVGKENTSALSMHELNMKFYPAQLHGRLLNACGDNGSMPLSGIENIKKITGGDSIMHEKKGKEPFFFKPFCKLLFSFNQMPLQLEEKSNAFYKRMRILNMENELFLNDAYVNDLCTNGVEEIIPYLLHLLPVMEIPQTERSNKLVEDLRQDSDSIHAFIAKKCVVGPDLAISKDEIYQDYIDFCNDLGREYHKKQGFIRNMRSQGFEEVRLGAKREAGWKGITLKKKER